MRIIISVLLCVVCGAQDGIICRYQILVNKFQAEKKCAEVGKELFDHSDISNNSVKTHIISLLKNRQSSWIAEYAKFSPFLIWDGCFENTLNFNSLKISYTGPVDLYTCSFECRRIDRRCTYIALKDTNCYCINELEKQLLEVLRIKSLCSFPCPSNGMEFCASNKTVSVYIVADVKEIIWTEQESSPRQCVKVKRVNQQLFFTTDSC